MHPGLRPDWRAPYPALRENTCPRGCCYMKVLRRRAFDNHNRLMEASHKILHTEQ